MRHWKENWKVNKEEEDYKIRLRRPVLTGRREGERTYDTRRYQSGMEQCDW